MPRGVYVRAVCADVCALLFAMCEARVRSQTFAGTGSIGERSTGGAPAPARRPPARRSAGRPWRTRGGAVRARAGTRAGSLGAGAVRVVLWG